MEPLNEQLGQAYAQALLAIARVDREVTPEESSRVRELVAKRTAVEVDVEASFFEKMTPEKLATAAREAKADSREVGKMLVTDAVALATTDGDLNSIEAQAILRFARALGCSDPDVRSQTNELDDYLLR